jgi:hypothetical protein
MDRRRRHRLILACAAALALAPGAEAHAQPEAPTCLAEACTPVSGVVRVASDRSPLANATVIVVPAGDERVGRVRRPGDPPPDPPWLVAATTDDEGRFATEAVPGPRVRVIVIAPGFLRDEYILAVDTKASATSEPTTLKAFVRPDPDQPYRTEVAPPAGPSATTAPTARVLEAEEIRTLPGSQGDPLRAIQNLPGAVRAPGGLGVLILRGAAPSQSRVFLGGLPIPRAFHVLSLSSIVPADILDRLDFIPGNFDARYGGATGGIVEIEPRAGRTDRVHGFGEIDLAAASALVEGPLAKGSFIAAAQRGYVDAVIAGASKVTERVTGEPNDLLLPSYYDYQGLLDYPIGPGRLGVRLFGAGDRIRAQQGGSQGFSEQFGGSGNAFEFRSGFHRVDVPLTIDDRRGVTRFIPSVRVETARRVVGGQALRRRRTDVIPAARIETERALGPHATLLVGTDFEVAAFRAVDEQQAVDPIVGGLGESIETAVAGVESQTGVYSTTELRFGRVTLRPGGRMSAFTVDDQAAFSFDPRLVGHVDVSDAWRISAGVGRYSQVRPISDRDTVDLFGEGAALQGTTLSLPAVFGTFDPEIRFAPGDSQLSVVQALQASAGAEVRFSDAWSASATGFFRNQNNGEPVVFAGNHIPTTSFTRTGGAELLLRRRLTDHLYGWLAYTLMFSELTFDSVVRDQVLDKRPSDFDQRHNLVLLGSYLLPHNWRIGGRFRVTSGFPFRPIIGSVNVRGGYLPVSGGRNTDRLGTFHQLDLRVDKLWIRSRATITAYLDIQNVYNRTNPEAILYSPDFRADVGVVGLPIFPSLGVRVDF